jgi:hypothetical protein
LSGYLGLTVPVVGIGLAAQFVSLEVALFGFAAVAAVLIGWAGLRRSGGRVALNPAV